MLGVRRIGRAVRRVVARVRRRGPAPLVLMYHRVAELPFDPWALAVSPRNFSDQLRHLKDERRLTSMDDLVEGLVRGTLRGNEVAITFDDGYIDNLTAAKPILEQERVPATVFLTTGRLGANEEFWWDELARLCLGGTAPVDATLDVAGRSVRVRLPAQPASAASKWVCDSPPRTERERAYLELWTLLQRVDEPTRRAGLEECRRHFGESAGLASNLPMRREDVPALLEGGVISVGGHARSHAPLSSLPSELKRDEIEGSKRELEALTARPISGFAYPYGDRDEETKLLARRAGYRYAVSTHSACIDRERFDPFDLPRMQVQNCGGPMLMQRIDRLGQK